MKYVLEAEMPKTAVTENVFNILKGEEYVYYRHYKVYRSKRF